MMERGTLSVKGIAAFTTCAAMHVAVVAPRVGPEQSKPVYLESTTMTIESPEAVILVDRHGRLRTLSQEEHALLQRVPDNDHLLSLLEQYPAPDEFWDETDDTPLA